MLPNPGEFHWRAEGERHMWDPQSIADIQVAARNNSPDAYQRFAEHINNDSRTRCQLRGLLKFKEGVQKSIPIDEVQSAKRNRQTLLHRRHVVRLDLGRSARVARRSP